MSARVPAVLGLALLGLLIAAAVRAPRGARAQEEAAPPAEEQQGASDEQLARFQERAEGSEDPRDWYNLGTAYLAAERWPEARPELVRAADEGEGKVGRFSRYNLGVANAMEGRPEGSAPQQERRERLIAARDAFREVLREDARMALERIPGKRSVAVLEAALKAAPEDFKPNIGQSLRARGLKVRGLHCVKLVPRKKTNVKAIELEGQM